MDHPIIPSVKISYATLTCCPCANYTRHNRIPPCSFRHAVHAICNVLLPMKYLYTVAIY